MTDYTYRYNYRVYGYTTDTGYKLVKKTNSYSQAMSYTKKIEYDRVLIVRHNIDLNMDEPIMLVTPNKEKVKVRTKK